MADINITTPITVTQVVEQQIQATGLKLLTAELDFSGPKITIAAQLAPFAVVNGQQVFARDPIARSTRDAVAAIANLPSMGAFLQSLGALGNEWAAYVQARQADAAALSTALAEAQANAATARTQLTAAQEARNTAFAARSGVDDPAWVAADAAWQQATANFATLNGDVDTLFAKLNATGATANDPAEPRPA